MADCDEGRNGEKGETMRETREGDGNKIRKKGRGRGTLGGLAERGGGGYSHQRLFKRKRDKQTVEEFEEGGNVNFQRAGRKRKE